MNDCQRLPTYFQEFIHLSRYARWNEEQERRETWTETVDRYLSFMCDKQCVGKIPAEVREELRKAILCLEVMPSMRCLMTAGQALERENVAGYNCSYISIDDPKAFDEMLYILMNGTGVGFSVERQFICNLPSIAEKFRKSNTVICVDDSRSGWASAYRELVSMLYAGSIPNWDVSKVRPAGARLKTFGGRASGPAPLVDLFQFTVATFKEAAGRKLNSIECHDICCKIGEIVVVGGVRRCLPGETPVFTPNGPKAIKDIRSGDVIVSGGKAGMVVAAGPSGKKDNIVIRHRFGKLECTPEHRVAVFSSIMKFEFKMAKDIMEGDRLVWDTVGYEGGKTELPMLDEDIHFNAKTPVVPELTTDVAWFLGLFHGDGCVEDKGVEISGNMKEIGILERAAGICNSAFGVESTVGNDGRPGAGARLRANSVVLSRWLEKNFKKPNETIRIPKFIFDAGRDIRFAYLSGLLDADGRVRRDGCIDQACTVYREYAEDLVTLLAGLGIAAFVSDGSAESRRLKGENAQDFYNVRIVGTTNKKMFYEGCLPFSCKFSVRQPKFSGFVDFSFPIRWAGTNQGYKSNGNILVSSMRYDLPLLPTRVTSVEKGRSVDTYDIQVEGLEMFTANGLVVHNSALISLSNPSDDRMRYAKSGEWWKTNPHRALANISACYTEKPGMDVFMREWLALYDSKSGERGIFNREAAKKNCAKYGRRDPNHDFGTNPCAEIIAKSCEFCVAGDTPMVTASGIVDIGKLEGREASVWNGDEWTPVLVRKTGVNQKLVRVHLSDGSYLDCTPYHRWSVKDRFMKGWKEVEAKDLMLFSKYAVQVEPAMVNSPKGGKRVKDAYTFGFAVGDGCVYNGDVIIDLHGSKDWDCPVEGKRYKPQWNYKKTSIYVRTIANEHVDRDDLVRFKTDAAAWRAMGEWNRKSVLEFVAGLADADGSETGTGGVRVYVNSYEKARMLQLVLAKHGIRCSVNLCQEKGDVTNLCERLHDLWYVQITECGDVPCSRLNTSLGHKSRFKGKYQVVECVEELPGEHDVYCFEEPKRHKAMFGNVLTFQCNLTEVVARPEDTEETIKRKIRLAVILGTMQATLTKFSYLRDIWRKNTEEEALLGVSITGIMDNAMLSGTDGKKKLGETLNRLREYAVSVNKEWALKLGINPATALSCVKPSGTVSALVNCSSGIHPRFSKYFVRTVRADKKDPLAKLMAEMGFPHEDDVTKPEYNWVFSFPMEAPRCSVLSEHLSAIDHLELWKTYQDHWAEHKPSVTIYVREGEWMDVGAWVYRHFDSISGVSFLPFSGHSYRQAPFQEITKEEYDKMVAKMPKDVEWSKLGAFEAEDNTQMEKTFACTGDSCEIVDIGNK